MTDNNNGSQRIARGPRADQGNSPLGQQLNAQHETKLVAFLHDLCRLWKTKASPSCSRNAPSTDMLAYDDVDHDTHLNLNEFYATSSTLSYFFLCITSGNKGRI